MPQWKTEPRQSRRVGHAARSARSRGAQELRMVHLRTPCRASAPQRTLLTLDPELLKARDEDRSGLENMGWGWWRWQVGVRDMEIIFF